MTSYMSYLVDAMAMLLDEGVVGAQGRGLLSAVLTTLTLSFEHDDEDFWQAPAHFGAIAKPLIDQLKGKESSELREKAVIAISGLAGAASSADHFKMINGELLQLMRSEWARTRLGAVQCQRQLSDSLGEEWLSLLPEMLPFITELLEDDDESVERETRLWMRTVEETIGESLEGMLQ